MKARQRQDLLTSGCLVPCVIIKGNKEEDYKKINHAQFPEWMESSQPKILDNQFFNTILIKENVWDCYYLVQSIDFEFEDGSEEES